MSRGFSFTEILFAVMILGIGFIMVAAMFPVAIQQTETSNQETVGAAIARAGVDYMTQVAQTPFVFGNRAAPQTTSMLSPTFGIPPANRAAGTILPLRPADVPALPPGATAVLPGQVWSCYDLLHDNQMGWSPQITPGPSRPHYELLWTIASQNMIQAADARFAWVALYKRDLIETQPLTTGLPVTFAYAPYAQVIVIAAKCQNNPTYSAAPPQADLQPPAFVRVPEPTLIPSFGQAQISAPGTASLGYTINFSPSVGQAPRRAAEGAFVIITDDSVPRNTVSPTTGRPMHGLLNGHVYRLGTQTAGGGWECSPGNGLAGGDAALLNPGATYSVLVVGMARDPNNPASYTGPAQDIAVYSTFVSCPN